MFPALHRLHVTTSSAHRLYYSLYLLCFTSSFAAVILTTATGGRVVRLISNCKLCVGVNVSVSGCLSLCDELVM